uniref:Uncharacterized protein n=1 Tax=Jaculus jaculus TaxID=51337 RepID=A0A8C5P2N1_JACJA
MLLLPTLVLFARLACRAQEMQGRNVGAYFYCKGTLGHLRLP